MFLYLLLWNNRFLVIAFSIYRMFPSHCGGLPSVGMSQIAYAPRDLIKRLFIEILWC